MSYQLLASFNYGSMEDVYHKTEISMFGCLANRESDKRGIMGSLFVKPG
jgi:hypothetical protein